MPRPPKSPRSRKARLAAGLALATCLTAACTATATGTGENPGPVVLAGLDGRLVRSARHQSLFAALQGAVQDNDTPLAELLVGRLRALELEPMEADLLAGFERVLDGRRLVGSLDFALESRPLDEPDQFRLLLVVKNDLPGPVELRMPPAVLRRLRVAVDRVGLEGRDLDSRTTHAFVELELGAGERREIRLLDYDLSPARALAIRERWTLEPRSGELEYGGEVYPAANLRVGPCERQRLPSASAGDTVEPEAFLLAVDDPELRGPDLLELAVHVPSGAREATLSAITPRIVVLAEADPARVAILTPALRWLSRTKDIGREPETWARYLVERAERVRSTGSPASDLDLPTPNPSNAPRGAASTASGLDLP